MADFIGRHEELSALKGLMSKRTASLVVIRGRRRIGKSRLVEEFSHHFPKSYIFSGIPPEKGVTAASQRKEFLRQLQRYKIPSYKSNDWGDLLDDLAQHCQEGPLLVLLDEITWMGGKDPTFIPKLKTTWDRFFKKNPQLILVISGSNSGWIQKNILQSTGFFGRISQHLLLSELSLPECNLFWKDWPGIISPYEKFKVLSVTGGVPRYLEELRPDLSAEQNIQQLCFTREGLLFRECDQMLYDLFQKKAPFYKQVLTHMMDSRLSGNKMASMLGRQQGGDVSDVLRILKESGFLARDYTWSLANHAPSKMSRYRVCDNYVRFYLKYIEPNAERIKTGTMTSLPHGWYGTMGLQFENLVVNQGKLFSHLLGLKHDSVVQAGPFFQTKRSRRPGCQIDYMVQTEFRTLYLFEIKFCQGPIGMEVVHQVQSKLDALQLPRGFSCRPVLVHINGVTPHVIDSGFFAKVLDFGELLG